MSKWTGLCAESSTEDSIYGEELYEGDTIYLLGVEGYVVKQCGACGWGSSHNYVPLIEKWCYRCSDCGHIVRTEPKRTAILSYTLCPNCGADMRKEGDEK